MSKTQKTNPDARDDLSSEYEFDYSLAKPNRFAAAIRSDTVAVVLDPDVAKVFRSSEAVNSLLRAVIAALGPSAESETA